jgi:hypothetical protein
VPLHGDLEAATERILESAWPGERRRALGRMAASTVGRVAVFLLALGALAAAVRLTVGVDVPWVFFAFMGGLALAAAVHDSDRDHLRRQPGNGADGGPRRPSTGCYPGGGAD